MHRSEPESGLRAWLPALVAIAAALLLFYVQLERYAINFPSVDEHDCGLEFLNRIAQTHSIREKPLILLRTQHNEYKPSET